MNGAGIRRDRALAWLMDAGQDEGAARAALDTLKPAARWGGVPYYNTRDLARIERKG